MAGLHIHQLLLSGVVHTDTMSDEQGRRECRGRKPLGRAGEELAGLLWWEGEVGFGGTKMMQHSTAGETLPTNRSLRQKFNRC